MGFLSRLDNLDRRFGAYGRSRGIPTKADRRVRYGLAAIGVGLLVAYLALAAWNAHHDRSVAHHLRGDGVVVDAAIVGYRTPYHLKGAHEVKVAFATAQGQQVETWVTVSRYLKPGPTRIRYLRTDPTVARLIDDLAPRSGDFVAGMITVLVLAALGFGVYRIGKGSDRMLGLDRS